MGVNLQLLENRDRKGRSVFINLPLIKATQNVMPIGLRRNYQSYSMEWMDRSEPKLTHTGDNPMLPELKSEKPRPIGPADDSGSVEPEDIQHQSDSEFDFMSTCRSDHRRSNVLEHPDIEGGISSPECLVDDNSHPLSHEISSGDQPLQSRTTFITSKSSFLSPIHVMTSSVVNSVSGCGLYGLAKPLLMRTRNINIKSVCIEENEPLKKAIVAQGYLESNEKTQGLVCHSANPTCVGRFINSIKYPTAKSCNSPYKDRLDKSKLGVVRLYKERHESDPGDVDNPSRNTIDCSAEPSGQNSVRVRGISHIFDFARSWLNGLLKNDEAPPVLVERQSFNEPRDVDEAKSSISWLKSAVPTTDFGLVSERAQARMKRPSTPPIVDRSPLNRDRGSLSEDNESLDAQRARELGSKAPTMPDKANSVENRVLSSCISEAAMSCVAALAPALSESRIVEKGSEPLYSSIDLGTLL